jgi:hypothetical protein
VNPIGERTLKQFTAYDPVARFTAAGAYYRATSQAAAAFLDHVLEAFPFPIQAIEVDGGSEFMAAFETACAAKGIRLFALPPRAPELNGAVERANGAWRCEFYALVRPAPPARRPEPSDRQLRLSLQPLSTPRRLARPHAGSLPSLPHSPQHLALSLTLNPDASWQARSACYTVPLHRGGDQGSKIGRNGRVRCTRCRLLQGAPLPVSRHRR